LGHSCATHLCRVTSLHQHLCTESAVVLSSSFSSSVFLSLRCEKPPPSSWTPVSEKTEVTSTHNPILTVTHRQEVLEGKNKVSVLVGGLIMGRDEMNMQEGTQERSKNIPCDSHKQHKCICSLCSKKCL